MEGKRGLRLGGMRRVPPREGTASQQGMLMLALSHPSRNPFPVLPGSWLLLGSVPNNTVTSSEEVVQTERETTRHLSRPREMFLEGATGFLSFVLFFCFWPSGM